MKAIYDKYRNLRSKIVCLFFRYLYGIKLHLGKNVYVRKGFTLVIEDQGTIAIGDNCFFNNFCSINSLKSIRIGDNCIFGENVHIYDHNHIYKEQNKPINEQGFICEEVIIGNNCWIGSNVVILKGVHIADHCVIGAGCVIYSDVAEGSVVINKQNLCNQNNEKIVFPSQ